MAPRISDPTQHKLYGYGFPSVALSLCAGLLCLTSAPLALASPVDCLTVLPLGGNQAEAAGVPSLLTPSFSLTHQRDIFGFGEFALTPSLQSKLLSKSAQFSRLDNPERTPPRVEGCGSQATRTKTPVNRAVIRGTGKDLPKYSMQLLSLRSLPHHGRRLVLKTRTTLPGLPFISRERTVGVIGPIQEPPGEQPKILNLTQGPALSVPLETQPVFAMDPLRNTGRLPVSESFRMDMTTTQALHGGNCANGCPY